MKIILRERFGNGYGCHCCSSETEVCGWINSDDAMLSFNEVLDAVFNQNNPTNGWNRNNDRTHLEHVYEHNGIQLYGWHIDYYKVREDVFVIINNRRYQIRQEFDERSHHCYTREQIEEVWKINENIIQKILQN